MSSYEYYLKLFGSEFYPVFLYKYRTKNTIEEYKRYKNEDYNKSNLVIPIGGYIPNASTRKAYREKLAARFRAY